MRRIPLQRVRSGNNGHHLELGQNVAELGKWGWGVSAEREHPLVMAILLLQRNEITPKSLLENWYHGFISAEVFQCQRNSRMLPNKAMDVVIEVNLLTSRS